MPPIGQKSTANLKKKQGWVIGTPVGINIQFNGNLTVTTYVNGGASQADISGN
jgi:hypothetical protein